MPTAIRPFKGAVVLLITLLVVILIGCGGGGGGGGGVTSSTATGGATGATTGGAPGTAQYQIDWPAMPPSLSRNLPTYTLSVVITASDFTTNQIVAQKIVNRSQGGSYTEVVSFDLPPGKYTITAQAKPNLNGGGDTIAEDTITTTVASGQTVSTTLSFTTLAVKLFIDDLPTSAAIGTSFVVHAHAEDQDGNAILLPTAALHWSIISGGQFAEITPDGNFLPLAPGSVTIQVQEVDSGILATKSITLVQGSTNGVVVIVS